MKNIYFLGAPTLAKGIEDYNYLASSMPAYKFHWFTFKIDSSLKSKYKNINFIEGLNDFDLKKRIKKDMSLLLSCSYYEGFCLPIAEALLLKIPVISYKLDEVESEFGNIIEYIECFKRELFIAKIEEVINRPTRGSHAEKAKNFIKSNYSPEIVSQKLLKVLFT